MSLIAQFLTALFSNLLIWFSSRVTKQVGMTIFAITVITTLSLALYLSIKGLVAGLVMYITNEWILMGMGILWPSNAEACITAIFTAELAVYIYRHKKAVYWGSVPK
ncbi:DUF5455 family protein [Vogesella indigofera]|uniref:DUF5455 family protein n=1 Tax=Vogesella indigofera TaxID=45465 RepID=UPI00234F4024|nr:DUF5455 family protein [Vogesella indigofera]MDC7712199.1 DUF5455 family protein [Vogesella indigofera]